MNSDFSEIKSQLEESNAKLVDLRLLEAIQWSSHCDLIKNSRKTGLTYQQIADILGISKGRVFQIVSEK